ncbi:MAG: glycosyl hydrolase, partial [Acidobacteriaceae bacterium]
MHSVCRQREKVGALSRRPTLRNPVFLALLLVACVWPSCAQETLGALHKGFADPPDDCRIMMRWWWFGPSVSRPEIQRELERMKAGGIGGVEIATLYPQALDDPATGFHNSPYLSDEHLDALRFAANQAARLGLRVDVTLGSGWPFGGPHIPVTQAAGELRVETSPIPPRAESVAVPSIGAGEQLLRAFLVPGAANAMRLPEAQATTEIHNGRLMTGIPEQSERTALFFIASRTGMMVKRPAVGAEGFVLDHYDQRAIATHLEAVGDRLLSAFGDHPPYAVFSDSLEDYGSDWTPDFPAEFRARRGYDISPYLPALIGDDGPATAAIRHDWGQTLTELANEHFLEPIHDWARNHHTLFRSQTYGFPPVTLSSNRYEDLPEGEGKATLNMWREFSDTRWAASAGHLFGKNVISSETWTWLHSPAFRATPLDMKAEADLHFLQGINQLVGHGWPYSPESAGEPGWRMYAAGALNAHNPWYFAMPDLTKYLQRVSFALRQGKPVADVALLLPVDDVWASFKARMQQKHSPTSAAGFDETGSNITIDESMGKFLGKNVIAQVLDAGFGLDFTDADAIDTIGVPYKVLILPDINRLPVKTFERVLEFARQGGIVIATRRKPATAPGFMDREAATARIEQISQTLFEGSIPTAHLIENETALGSALASYLQPDLTLIPKNPSIGFTHRALPSGDMYFIANTSNRPQQVAASFRSQHRRAEIWDAMTGEITGAGEAQHLRLTLAPYESRIVYLSDEAARLAGRTRDTFGPVRTVDVSEDWQVRFDNSAAVAPVDMKVLHSISDETRLRYYSGSITYEKTLNVPA